VVLDRFFGYPFKDFTAGFAPPFLVFAFNPKDDVSLPLWHLPHFFLGSKKESQIFFLVGGRFLSSSRSLIS